MAFAFWNRLLKLCSGFVVDKAAHKATPSRSLMSVERLEDRTVPSTAFNVLGPADNPTVNAALPSTGLSIATSPGQIIGSSPFPTSAASGPPGLLVGAAAVNSLGLADASVRLFASSAVNSLGLFNQAVPTFAPDAYGFGSGTQPGTAWAPAAYNVGLANQQTSYPSIADHGFQATPPWLRSIHKYIQENDPPQDDRPIPAEDLTLVEEQVNDAEVPLRTYRLVSPEQVLDEVEPPATLDPRSLQSGEQLHDPAIPSSKQGVRVEGETEDELSASVPAVKETESVKAVAREFPDKLGLVYLDDENNVPSLEAVSLTEFPTLSRMLLLPSLSTLLMEFPLPAVRIDSAADSLESAGAGFRLITDMDLPPSGE